MAPNIPSAKITLSCPLFAADFDPQNNGFLLVGGGGGEGRSGVGNKIALLSTHRRNEISEVVDIELSRDEDSVTSLAASKSTEDSITALAGINSSLAEQQKGKNEHLRSFEVGYPPKKGTETATEGEKDRDRKLKEIGEKTTALGRASLFRPKYAKPSDKPETYQRLTRLSQWKGEAEPRIGAISTGLAPQGEIVLFDATVPSPQQSDVIGRIRLGDGEEAEDVDMMLTGDSGDFTVGYIDGISLFTCKVSPTTRSNVAPDTTSVYTIPQIGSKKKSKIRAVRFLSSTSALLLQNLPDRNGCELVIVTADGKKPQWKVTRRVRLPSKMKIGLGLDVCPLSASTILERQYIVAVSGSDHSISTFTLEYIPRKGFSKFRPYATLRDVHPFTMTRITFSTFIPPKQPISSDIGAQYVKLASVSVGNTVVVHTFPLSPIPPASVWARYVLVRPGPPEIVTTIFSTFMALLVVAFGAFFIQAFTEIRGGTPPYLGAKDWLSPRIRDKIANPYIFENGMPEKYYQPWPPTSTSTVAAEPTGQTLSRPLKEVLAGRLQSEQGADATPAPGKVVIRDQGGTQVIIQTQAPDEETSEEQESIAKWEDLSDDLREAWRQKLIDAGHWAADEGEAILQGLFFGEVGGQVNQQEP